MTQTLQTRKVWIESDPEAGMGIVKYTPSMRSFPTIFREAAVPVELIERYKKASRDLKGIKTELYEYFAAAKY